MTRTRLATIAAVTGAVTALAVAEAVAHRGPDGGARTTTMRMTAPDVAGGAGPRGRVRVTERRNRTVASANFTRLAPGAMHTLRWDGSAEVAARFTSDHRGRARLRGMTVPGGAWQFCFDVSLLDENGDPLLVHHDEHMDGSGQTMHGDGSCDPAGSGMHGGGGSSGDHHISHHGGSGAGGGGSMHGGGGMMR